MENPFEAISERLDRIENHLEVIIDKIENKSHSDNPLPKFMTVKSLASYLSVAKQTIYGYTHRRQIPYSKRGKRLYFNKEEIDSWIFEGKQNSINEIEKITDDFLSSRGHKYR